MTDDATRILQAERQRWFQERCGRESWFDASRYEYDERRSMGWLWAYLVPASNVAHELEQPAYEARDFAPALSDDGTRYLPHGNDLGIQPLTHLRSWHGVRPSELEATEDFRLFFNLFRANDGNLYALDDSGLVDELVVRFGEKRAEIRNDRLQAYLATTQMALVACIDWREHSPRTLEDLGLSERHEEHQADDQRWRFDITDLDGMLEMRAFSRLLGKKVISPPPREESGIWPFEREAREEFQEFIVGVDGAGGEIRASCNPDELGTPFDRAAGRDPYLTPVHFRREVLDRYYARADRFTVEDGYLRCGGLWGMSIDNNHPQHVVAYLGDLGRDLPAAERPHWLLHNARPAGPPESETSFRRNRLAQFTEPEALEHRFRAELARTNAAWRTRFGWEVFKPLRDNDAALPDQVRRLATDTETALDEQVRVLAKMTVESISGRLASLAPPEESRSIRRLGSALRALGIDSSEADEVVETMTILHELNNGVRHRKSGNRWEQAYSALGLPGRSRIEAFDDLLQRVVGALIILTTACESNSGGADEATNTS